jgi:hypothetical protein
MPSCAAAAHPLPDPAGPEFRANRIRKSVGAQNTFSSDLTDFDAMAVELQPLKSLELAD